jgi:hypothetical protein
MNIIYQKPGYLTVSHNSEKNYILFDWTNFGVSLEEIKEAHKKALDTAKISRCYSYIAETSKVKNALSQEVLAWFGTWVPVLNQYGLKEIITVVPASAVAKLSTSSWQKNVVAGISMVNVKTLEEAEATLNQI